MSALSQLSDGDLLDLYQDTNRGIRKNSKIDPEDTNSEGSWDANDYYRGHNQTYNEGTGLGHEDDNKMSELWGRATEGMASRRPIRDIHDDVRSEYHRRQSDKRTALEGRLSALENAPKQQAVAPKQEAAAPVEEVKPEPKPEVELEEITPFKDKESQPVINGFSGSTWNPEGGTEAPGLAEYSKAKEKAQSFQASSAKPDYSFNAGAYGSKPAATPSGAYGSGDLYGNVSSKEMNSEHEAEQLKNSHLGRAKSLL